VKRLLKFIIISLLICLAITFYGCSKESPSRPTSNKPSSSKIESSSIIGGSSSLSGTTSSNNSSSSGKVEKVYVNFVDENGEFISSTSVNKGSAPVYGGEVPTKASNAQYTYTFVGWTADGVLYAQLPAITKNTVFKATFSETLNSYTISYMVAGETTTETLNYGEMPSYKGETQFIKNNTRYTILGWDKEFSSVTKAETYVAEVEVKTSASITFVVEGESLIMETQINSVPVFYGTPYKARETGRSFTFNGWRNSKNEFYLAGTSLPVAVLDETYTAEFVSVWDTYSVTFEDENGNVLFIDNVEYGTSPEFEGAIPTKQTTQAYSYPFAGWTNGGILYTTSLPQIYENQTFTATYNKVPVNYDITVNYYVGEELKATNKENVAYGDSYKIESPIYEGYVAKQPYVVGIVDGAKVIRVDYSSCEVWDGTTATAFASGTGTETDPYVIKTGAQLAYLGKIVADNTSAKGDEYCSGIYYKLGNSLDLSSYQWVPIGVRESLSNYNWTYFAGNFDGCGYTINFKITNSGFGYGLFQAISGTVKNLNLTGEISINHRAGALTYISSETCNISNITSYVNIKLTSETTQYSGGIIGSFAGTMSNCYNYGNVIAVGNRIGGVVGSATTGVTITNCYNYGKVTATTLAGGIVGYLDNASASVTGCYNYGYIVASEKYAGGIAGQAKTTGTTTITNCKNYGAVSALMYGGGIAGTAEKVNVSNCVNYGSVYVTDEQGGGIVGYNTAKISDCTNNGKVVSNTTYAGGIVGNDATGTVYENCTNNGEVLAYSNYAGGIAGHTRGTFTNCTNNGDIWGAVYTGGVVGSSVNGVLTDCKNYGNVTALNPSSAEAKGFAGIVGWATYTTLITNCENHANVTAYTNVGGVVGYMGAAVVITTSTNSGVITGRSSTGDIAGYNNGGTIK